MPKCTPRPPVPGFEEFQGSVIDEVVKSQQNDGFDVGAPCGRPGSGERSSPLQCKARKS